MRLFLNNTEADVFPDSSPVAVTFALAPLGEISVRRANVSTSFRIPLSDRNRGIIDLADVVQASSAIPYTVLDCTLEQEGVRVIDNGKAVVESIGPDGIELTAYSGLFSFFDAIDGLKLQDLNYDNQAHSWTAADVAIYTNPTALSDGFVWAIADLGILGSTTVDISYQRPAVTLASLCAKIAEAQGYTLAGAFWTSEPFTRTAILLMESDEQRRRDFTEARSIVYKRDEATLVQTTLIDNTGPYNPSWQVLFSIPEDPGDNWNGNAYTETTRSVLDFKAVLTWADYSDNDISTEYAKSNYTTELIHIDGGGIETVLDSNVSLTFAHTATVEDTDVVVAANERVIVRVSFDVTQPGPPAGYNLNLQFNLKEAEIKTTNVRGSFVIGSTIAPSSLLPDLTQKDFLSYVARLFGLVLTVDEAAGTVTATRYQDILTDTGNAVDWSEKLIPVVGTIYAEKRTRADGYGQRSVLRFENDELSPYPDYGRSWLTVNDATLEREQVIADVPFATSGSVTSGFIPIPLLYAKLYDLATSTERDVDFTDRLTLLYGTYTGKPGLTLLEGSGGPTVAVAAGDWLAAIPVADDAGAQFDRYLLRDNYAAVQSVLESYQEIDCFFMFDAADITGLDLARLVYLRQFSSYFYVEEVSNFVYGQPTRVRLVKA